MMISFRLNRRNDNELISLLSQYENNNMSEFIRSVLRDSLLTSRNNNNVIEDVFANDVFASNTDNVNVDTNIEIRQINRKTEIIIENKPKVIVWSNIGGMIVWN